MTTNNFPATRYSTIRNLAWANESVVRSETFVCGFCSNEIASNKGFAAAAIVDEVKHSAAAYIYVCHKCGAPTYFSPSGQQHPPGARFKIFDHVPEDLSAIYVQARTCFTHGCFEACVMVARRLLMVLAWRLQAKEGESFQFYVEYFVTCGALAPAMKVWVDKIRQIGNASNHEVPQISQDQAQNVLKFVELIFENVFEASGAAGVPSPYALRGAP